MSIITLHECIFWKCCNNSRIFGFCSIVCEILLGFVHNVYCVLLCVIFFCFSFLVGYRCCLLCLCRVGAGIVLQYIGLCVDCIDFTLQLQYASSFTFCLIKPPFITYFTQCWILLTCLSSYFS